MILKLNGLGGGVGAVAGWEPDAATRRRALEDSAADGCIVQQRVIPRPEPVVDPVSGETEEWHAVYGMFYTPQGCAGADGRVVPAGSGGIITGTSHAKARGAAVFYQSDGAAGTAK